MGAEHMISSLRFARTSFNGISRTMATRTKIVGGNWKCNAGGGTTLADVNTLVEGLNAGPEPKCQTYLCPPSIYLQTVKSTAAADFDVAAQNCWKVEKGAYTGEVSPAMLQDMGINWTLIGHSERRDIFGETDALLGEKIAHCMEKGMNVVACIGEHKEDREAGKTMEVLIPQLEAIVANTSDWSRMVVQPMKRTWVIFFKDQTSMDFWWVVRHSSQMDFMPFWLLQASKNLTLVSCSNYAM